MLKETLEQSTQNIIPESFNSPQNEALLNKALSPFKDWQTFSKLPPTDIIASYDTLMKAVLTAFGVKDEVQFVSKYSTNYFGIFIAPSTIVLNRFLLRIKHSIHTIIHECTHVYLYNIRNGNIPFNDKILYNTFRNIHKNYADAQGFYIQPEEIYTDLVAYQLLQKYKFPTTYSISSKQSPPKIKNPRLKTAIAIGEFILTLILVLSIKFTPTPLTPVVLSALLLLFLDMPQRLFWLEDCLKGRSKHQLVKERFEQLMALWKPSQ